MEWSVIDNHPDITIVDDIIANFKETMRNSGIKCKITVELATYPEPKYNILSLMTSSQTTRFNREPAKLQDILVNIEFNMPSAIAEKLAITKLSLTTDLTPWATTPIHKEFPYCCGVYKRPGFDDAYKAMNKLKPKLTEQGFARNEHEQWDEELVSLELFHGWDNCIATKTAYERINTGESKVILSLSGVDLDANMTYITTLLSPYS